MYVAVFEVGIFFTNNQAIAIKNIGYIRAVCAMVQIDSVSMCRVITPDSKWARDLLSLRGDKVAKKDSIESSEL